MAPIADVLEDHTVEVCRRSHRCTAQAYWSREGKLLMAKRLAAVLFVVSALLALSQRALAAPRIVVGNGTAASCTETALGDAVVIAASVGGSKDEGDSPEPRR